MQLPGRLDATNIPEHEISAPTANSISNIQPESVLEGHVVSDGRDVPVTQVPPSGMELAQKLRARYSISHDSAIRNGDTQNAARLNAAEYCASWAVLAHTHAKTAENLGKTGLAHSFENHADNYLKIANRVVEGQLEPTRVKDFIGSRDDTDWNASLQSLTHYQIHHTRNDDFKKSLDR